MSLADLSASEKDVFAALVRLAVRMDLNFSDEEAGAIQKISNEIGHKEFWALMEKSADLDEGPDEILERAKTVTRAEAHELIYGNLFELTLQGGIDTHEEDMLTRLTAIWNLEVEQQDPQFDDDDDDDADDTGDTGDDDE